MDGKRREPRRGPNGMEIPEHRPAPDSSGLRKSAAAEIPNDPEPMAALQRGELRYHTEFASSFLGNQRTLAGYLPPGYAEDPRRRYPVFYLHDGQNVFDAATAAFGVEWEADDTADRLTREGQIGPLILVGIYNTPNRFNEYTVHYDPVMKAGGKGKLYGRFVMDEVKL